MLAQWLDHPAVQGALAPLVVALLVALALWRTRFAWLAIVAGYLVMLLLSGDFAFDPLTAARKVSLVGLVSAAAGLLLDRLSPGSQRDAWIVAVVAGLLSLWVFVTVLRQREGAALVATAVGVAVFVAALVHLVIAQRADGIRVAAAGFGLGIATSVAGVLSASLGYLVGGASIAAASGAMLLLQALARRDVPAGYTGALPIGMLTASFAAATLLLAQLPWYALPLLAVVPLALRLPLPAHPFARAAAAGVLALVAAAFPILAAWYAARGSLS